MKDTVHHPVHLSVHFSALGSVPMRRTCALRSTQFGRGQNAVLGWNDPDFDALPRPKKSARSFQPSVLPADVSAHARQTSGDRVLRSEDGKKCLLHHWSLPRLHPRCIYRPRAQRIPATVRAKVTARNTLKSGGSDPTFLRTIRPNVSWGRSRPRRHFASTFCAVASAGARVLSDEMSDILYEIERGDRCQF